MTCYNPLTGYRAKARTVNGKRGIVFSKPEGYVDQPIDIPCGKCIGCRLEYARQWAIRCMHEASLHEENCFVTLTYADSNMPYGHTLVKRDYQLFMKRLRHYYDRKIRFFACGEYGEETLRPHYHACLFGYMPRDLRPLRRNKNPKNGEESNSLYTSDSLTSIWSHGYVTVGEVTFESAGYCARYITKKILGDKQAESYWRVDTKSGVIHQVAPEFALMSRRPGIGKEWIDKFGGEVYRHDSVIVNGREVLPPDYYDNQLSELQKQRIKDRRKRKAQKNKANSTIERLRVREDVKVGKLTHRRNQI